jgi:predicted RNA binding protein YcfA (HicA-like mRNA interferase family)
MEIRPRDLIRALEKADWYVARQGKGSHVVLRNRERPGMLIIALHGGGKSVPSGTLRSILRDARITEDELRKLISR